MSKTSFLQPSKFSALAPLILRYRLKDPPLDNQEVLTLYCSLTEMNSFLISSETPIAYNSTAYTKQCISDMRGDITYSLSDQSLKLNVGSNISQKGSFVMKDFSLVSQSLLINDRNYEDI